MSKSYLVTGGAGFIGSHLCEALVAQGNRVVIVDNMMSGKRENISGFGDRVELIEGDIRRIGDVEERLGELDAVIHLAALISGYDSLSAPDEYNDVNLSGLLRIIEMVTRRRIPRIIFASSSTVYGNNGAQCLNETVLPAPLTVYALTKLAGEHLLDLYSKLNGFSHCSLRLFNVYGPRQAIDHPYANVTCKFAHAAANRLPVKRYGDGEQSRDFVYVADVVRAFLAVLPGSQQTIYNVGTGSDRKINELISILSELDDTLLPVEECEAWANDIRQIRADTRRFEQEFGFVPAVSLREGLSATVNSFRSPILPGV